MTGSVNRRRPYDSTRRKQQARVTRDEVLNAARELFVRGGYIATTIGSIAAHAGVSPETVYASFTNKRTLLSDLIDVSMAGDDEPVPILRRPWVQHLRAEPDPRRRVRLLARNGRMILERVSPIYEVLRGAAAADPELASLLMSNRSQRLTGQRELVRLIAAGGSLREGLSVAAATDTVYAIGNPETYRLLVVDRGWSPDRFERWYADSLIRLLLR